MKRWRAKQGGRYYFVAVSMTVLWCGDHRDSFDEELFNAGNYFKNKNDAYAMAEKMKALLKENMEGGQQ